MLFTVELHDGQLEILDDPHRFRTLCAGRRFGKSRLIINDIITSALGYRGTIDPISPQVILATEPTLVMAKPILWKPLVSIFTETNLNSVVKDINRSEHRISFLGQYPDILVTGANDNNGDGMRGKRIYRYYGDEFQDTDPSVLDLVITPAMADTPGSRALLAFTPKGKTNHTYKLAQRSLEDPETYRHFHMKTSDNPFVPRDELERARRTMPPKRYRQEFEASWESFDAQIYSELTEDNIVDSLPSSFDLTVLGVDWGDVNPAFTVWGLSDNVWYFCEGWSGYTGNPVTNPEQDKQILRLASTWDVRATYCDPSRPSNILAARALGVANNQQGLARAIAGFNRIEEGINQVHSLIYQRRLKFPRVCPGGLAGSTDPMKLYDQFVAYQRKVDKNGLVTEVVKEGQVDHLIDSTRYALAVSTGNT